MSLGVCFPDLVASGKITATAAEKYKPIYEGLVAQYEGRYGRAAAEAMATRKTVDALEADFKQRKRQQLLQVKAQQSWLMRMKQAVGDGQAFTRRAAEDFLIAVDKQRHVIRGRAHGMMVNVLEKHRRDVLGRVRQKDALDDMVQELHGRDSGNANARELADAWRQTSEMLRQRFNAAGGHIAKAESWNLPQSHDMRAVRGDGSDAAYAQWRDFVVPLLDRQKMLDRETGVPMSDARLELILRDAWEAIATDGWTRNNPGAIHAGATANRRADHRVLHFADADGWLAYADTYGGKTNPFDAMMAHIDGMSRDIAMMEMMGPNPNATARFQQDWIRKSAALTMDQKAIDGAEGAAANVGRMFDEISGRSVRPENRRLALGFGAFRSVQVSAKLGGAVLSAVSDVAMNMHARRFNGLPAMKTVSDYVRLLNPANKGDRDLAVRLGLVAEEWSNMAAAQHRYTGEELTGEISRRMAEFVLRSSGLSAVTQSGRWGFGMELVNHITMEGNAGKGFAALDKPFRDMLQRYDIGADGWDALRAAPRRQERGQDWLFPEDIADQVLADRMMRMILTEVDYAVPVPDLRTRTLVNTIAPKGTLAGEVVRSAFLFKSFPLTILNLHMRRMFDQAGGWNKAKYGLTLFAATTVAGAVALQLKEVARGRDPKPMNDPSFIGAAMFQGGGLGIFGDLLKGSENRFGGGLAETLAGPGIQSVGNFADATIWNIKKELDGDEKSKADWANDMMRILRQEVPGSSLWYTRAAYDRLLGDMIQTWIDPEAAKAFDKLEKRAEENGNAYFIPPGALGESRLPDMANMWSVGAVDEAGAEGFVDSTAQ